MDPFSHPPAFSPEHLCEMLREAFDLRGTCTPLPSERDQNSLVTTEDGRRYVLKIAHVMEKSADLETQNRVLVHLAQTGVRTPRLVLNRQGQAITWVRAQDGRGQHGVRLLTYLDGRPLAKVAHRSPGLYQGFGAALATMDKALSDLGEPAINAGFPWDPAMAETVVTRYLPLIKDRRLSRQIRRFLPEARQRFEPLRDRLPRSLIYNDANDHNVLIQGQEVSGFIDFGDMVSGWTVADLATACAYALLGERDPWMAILPLVAGYHRVRPLSGDERSVLFDLIGLRLCVSASMAAWQAKRRPEEAYLFISQGPVVERLPALLAIDRRLARARLDQACGLDPLPQGPAVMAFLQAPEREFAPVLPLDLGRDKLAVLDLGIASPLYVGDPNANTEPQLTRRVNGLMTKLGAKAALGQYREARLLYTSDLFRTGGPGSESRTVHLGIDLFMPAQTPVSAPLDGQVFAFARNRARLDYGPVIILEHRTDDGIPFYTLYGHLSPDSLRGLSLGQTVRKGEAFARLGSSRVNGGWTPHLHFQIILDPLGLGTDFPGVSSPSDQDFWCRISPDANLMLRVPAERLPARSPTKAETLVTRKKRIGPSLSIGYNDPVKVVRGWMQYLYDEGGRKYLDCYNNVPHVGHAHPKVVEALQSQAGILATNTRYLHDHIGRYAEALTATLPPKLEVCYFLNSASEANELALRMARTFTGQRDMIVLEAAYHGHTTSLIDISPYKHNGPGGQGAPDWVHTAPLADVYRGRFKADDPEAGLKYAAGVGEIIASLSQRGRGPAGFIAESCPSVGGQIFFPEGYLKDVYRQVRGAGGICIADEVQTGYGRIGTGFYAFETQGVEPDMVILGKPIGNGHPLGALITTRDIADAFHNGMEFFSTFGGNTVSSLVGLTVLQVVREEGLMAHALETGDRLLAGLRPLRDKYPLVGDVRGSGLFLGVELVRDRESLEPADREASYVVNRLREQGILLGTDGPYHNVIKIRPPMPFNAADADRLITVLDQVLGELKTV